MPWSKERKASRAVKVEIVARLQAEGRSKTAIKKYADDHEWGVSTNVIQRYMNLAIKRSMAIISQNMPAKLGQQLAKLDRIYEKCMANGKEGVALKAMEVKNRLLGLNPDSKLLVEHTGAVEHQHAHAHALFAQIDSYTDEFRLAAKAEAIEAQTTAVTRGDRVAAGLPVEKEPKWEDKPVILPDGTECVPCEDDTDEALEDDDREEDAMVRDMHPLERMADPIYAED